MVNGIHMHTGHTTDPNSSLIKHMQEKEDGET